jgi:hypothetical protein
MTTHFGRICRWIARLAPAALAGAAHAQCVGMAAGSLGYIELENSATPCAEAATGAFSIPYPSANYCESAASCNAGRVLYANADSTPNRMRISGFQSRGSQPILYSSMADTFTISGPPGSQGTPVTFNVRCRMVGTIYSIFNGIFGGNPNYALGGSVGFEVGTFAHDSNSDFHEQFRVTAFGPAYSLFVQMPAQSTTSPRVLPFDMTLDQPLTRNVDEAFELGFGLTSSAGTLNNPSGNPAPSDSEYCITTIDFTLPEGYHITSLRGWTDPDAPSCGTADFNGDGDLGTDGDIEAFFSCLAGSCCATCGTVDFNHDGDLGTDGDIESFFRVLAGGAC